jgi:hypothetical protein
MLTWYGVPRGGGFGICYTDLLNGGDLVSALTYARASEDKKEQGKSVTDQRKLNHTEVARHSW